MTRSEDSTPKKKVYFNDPESRVEMTRLLDHVIQECLRIARPGGVIRLCECEYMTNGLACEKMQSMYARALYVLGQSFSPDGRLLSMFPMLAGFLKQGGCQNLRQAVSVLDFSAGTEANSAEYRNLQLAYEGLRPFFMKAGVTTEGEFDQAYEQMQREIVMGDFRGLLMLLSAWGHKP